MKKILIVKIGAIGDVIMTLPVVSEIKKKLPEAHITWICGEVVYPILANIPDINEIITLDEQKLFSENISVRLGEVLSCHRKIALRKFEDVLIFHPDFRYRFLTVLVRSKRKVRLSREGERPSMIPGRSRPFERVRLFLGMDDNYPSVIQFPRDAIPCAALTPGTQPLQDRKVKRVILAPGGAKNLLQEQALKRWPIENYVRLAKFLREQNYEVILSGADSDEWIIPYFEDIKVVNAVGKLNLPELVSLMRESDLVITHDSGPFHLAVLAQHPHVIALFGPTNPFEFNYGENFDRVKFLWKGTNLLCSPCYYGKHFSSQCKNNICMQGITPEAVFEEVEKLKAENIC